MRGEKIDIGGRSLRVVRQGPLDGTPTVLFEAGAFGVAADWAVVQEALGPEVRTVAYDRAGLGFSDPGPRPRDSRAVASDLRKLIAASGEAGPFVLVGHGMAAAHLYVFAQRYPDLAKGLVLADAAPPEALDDPQARLLLRAAQGASLLAPLAARLSLGAAARATLGDPVDPPLWARRERAKVLGASAHIYWSALEVRAWRRDAEEALALGEIDREMPVATVTAGGGPARWKAAQSAPARRSRSGYAANVRRASHAGLLGPRYAGELVKAILFIRESVRQRTRRG